MLARAFSLGDYAVTISRCQAFEIYGPGVGIGLRKEDDDLRRNLNSALVEVKKSGTYKKLAAKYFPYDISGD